MVGYFGRNKFSVADMEPGMEATVVHIRRGRYMRERLASLGIYPGVKVKVVSRGPLGGNIEIRVNNVFVSVSRQEADGILVSPISQ